MLDLSRSTKVLAKRLAPLLIDGLTQELTERGTIAPRFLTIEGAANWVSVSTDTIRCLLRGRNVSKHSLRGRVLIDRLELERLVVADSTDECAETQSLKP